MIRTYAHMVASLAVVAFAIGFAFQAFAIATGVQ